MKVSNLNVCLFSSSFYLSNEFVPIFRPNIISAGNAVLLSIGLDLYASSARWDSLLASFSLSIINFTVQIVFSMKAFD